MTDIEITKINNCFLSYFFLMKGILKIIVFLFIVLKLDLD